MSTHRRGVQSPVQCARALGARLEGLGFDIFASPNERYAVLLQDAPGEIIELGRPLRGSRIFANEAVRKNIPVVEDFKSFAAERGLEDCLFWCIGLTGAKAEPAELTEALTAFNAKINIEFSELRKRHGFELLLITIHPRFDHQTGRFDLHAHFVCRVPPAHRDATQRRLSTKFSKVDLPAHPIRNAAAVATYMLWGIWRNDEMISWPDQALAAAWHITQRRFRLFRAGGSFAKWRTSKRDTARNSASTMDKATIEKNRSETKYERTDAQPGDRLLSRIKIRYGGKKVAALLFEASPRLASPPQEIRPNRNEEYSSANSRVTQDTASAKRGKQPDFLRAAALQNVRLAITDLVAPFVRQVAALPRKLFGLVGRKLSSLLKDR